MSDLYQEIILAEVESPQHVGTLANADIVQQANNPSCGDDMTVYIDFDEEGKSIKELTWQGNGCAISQATMSMLATELQGKPTSAIANYSQEDLETLIGIDKISLGRVKCLMLGLKAVQAAIAEYQANQGSTNG